jgi:long-chain fatty acid transport protein
VNLIGIGALARSVDGVSIAAPQEEISAVFSNPAAMCVRNRCEDSGLEVGSTFFIPKVETAIKINDSIGYVFTRNFEIHLGSLHAFKQPIKETGTDLVGNPVTLESSLSQDSIDPGLHWRF